MELLTLTVDAARSPTTTYAPNCSALTHYATRAAVADLRANVHALEARLIRWILGLMLSATGLAVAITVAVDRLST